MGDNYASADTAERPTKIVASDDESEQQKVYSVEKILDHRRDCKKILYWVKWDCHLTSDNSWISIHHFEDTEILQEYWDSVRDVILETDKH